ncbi:MAG: hypothetical protein L3K26_14995, partial [Candidatus Hydrogenedentes bacterium]|nr:hypothetical protein [Candidatus Hydrogenedentota bacterium]
GPPQATQPQLLFCTSQGLLFVEKGAFRPFKVLDEVLEEIVNVSSVAVNKKGHTIVATSSGAYQMRQRAIDFSGPPSEVEKVFRRAGWRRILPEQNDRGWTLINAQRVMVTEDDILFIAAPQGVARQAADGEWTLFSGADGLPYNDFTAMDVAPDGRLWLGTSQGAIHYDGEHWAYRAGKRWLPNNEVRDIAATEDGAWIATASGVSHIYFQPTTFAEKAAFYESEIDRYHRRTPFGYVAGVSLEAPGDKSKWTQHDTDNDGQYSGLYGAAECLAYGATGDPKAKERATNIFEALAFLSEVTQSGSNPAPPGFIARTILSTDGPNPNEHNSPESDRKKQERDALWKVIIPRWPTSGDGKWYWKTDASSDELDGHFLLYGLYYDHVAETEAEKAQVREVAARVMDHLIEHNFRLVDHDGKPTRWANFRPESLNGDPNWWTERGLNSFSLLTYLNVTYHITGEQKYRDVFMDLVDTHHYGINGMVMPKLQAGPGSHVQFDDKMSFMNFYSLIRYEKDQRVLRMFQNAIFYYWQIVKPERNPFFNFVYAALCEGQGMTTQWGVTDLSPTGDWLGDSVDTLKRFPLDLVIWPTKNSHRIDLIPLGEHTREPGKAKGHGYRVDGYVIPIDERNALTFSEDTWRYDDLGGGGKWLDEGSPFLLAYYLGLYHGFIVE